MPQMSLLIELNTGWFSTIFTVKEGERKRRESEVESEKSEGE